MVRTYRMRWFVVAVMLSIGGAGSGRVYADPLMLKHLDNGTGVNLIVRFTDLSSGDKHGAKLKVFAGAMDMQLQNGTSSTDFIGYNVDLSHIASHDGAYKVDAFKTSSGLANGAQIAYLANTYGPYFGKITDPVQRSIEAAGLQVAIWSELYNNGNGFSSGVFQFHLPKSLHNAKYGTYLAIANAATTFLADAQNNSAVSTWYNADPSGRGERRGQSVVLADPPAAPEPPTVILFGLGLVGLGIVYRRNRSLRFA